MVTTLLTRRTEKGVLTVIVLSLEVQNNNLYNIVHLNIMHNIIMYTNENKQISQHENIFYNKIIFIIIIATLIFMWAIPKLF